MLRFVLVNLHGQPVASVDQHPNGTLTVPWPGGPLQASSPDMLAVVAWPHAVRAQVDATLDTGLSTQACTVFVVVNAPPAQDGQPQQWNYRVEVVAESGAMASPWREDFLEVALADVHAQMRLNGVPRLCSFCRFSDYPPQMGAGALHCFVGQAEVYVRTAISRNAHVRRRGVWDQVPGEPVSEFHTCPRFENRPAGFGHRG